jgi:hypothetical protein
VRCRQTFDSRFNPAHLILGEFMAALRLGPRRRSSVARGRRFGVQFIDDLVGGCASITPKLRRYTWMVCGRLNLKVTPRITLKCRYGMPCGER